MTFFCKPLAVVTALSFLAACGGGSGPVLDPVAPPPPVDEVLETEDTARVRGSIADQVDNNDNKKVLEGEEPEPVETTGSVLEETLEASEEEVIVLSGLGLATDPETGARVLVRQTGEFKNSDGSRTLDGVAIVLTDDVPGVFVDTSGFVGDSTNMTGIVGLATDAANIPTSGTASFSGGAVLSIILPDEGFDLVNGQSNIDVNFRNGRVTADLSNFTAISQLGGKLADNAPIDRLVLTGAQISGSGFSGGTLTTTGSMTLADITGNNATVQSEGQFFGGESPETGPAEVGGLIHAEGDNGLLFGSFIAD